MYELEVGVGCFKTAGKALSGLIGKSASEGGEYSDSGADESGDTAGLDVFC